MKPLAETGQPLSRLDTPALIVDPGAFETNLKAMAGPISGGPAKLRGLHTPGAAAEDIRPVAARGALS